MSAPAAGRPLRLVLATANPDKAAEVQAILRAALPSAEVLPRPASVPDVVEDAPDLEGNARLKAAAVCEATGLPALADDTGLEVDALGGQPGVRSARYAGEHASYADNVAKLLAALEGVPGPERSARFRTAALCRFPGGSELLAIGECPGRIATEARGSAGFGYDPVFVPDGGDGRTFAEMTGEEKAAVSHRGLAFRRMAELLRGAGQPTG